MNRCATLAVLAVAVIALAAPRLKDTAKEPVYFPTVEGTTLVYEVGASEQTVVVTKVEKNDGDKIVHVHQVQPGGKMTPLMVMRVGKDGLTMLEEVGQKYDPPWHMLRMPLKADESWDAKTTRAGIGAIAVTRTARSLEELTVPAGTFTAVPVEVVERGGGAVPNRRCYWYVEGIGWAKITVNGNTIKELKSVNLGEKK
jgi:hypothetical protein